MKITEHSGDNEFVIPFAEAAIREFCLSWAQNQGQKSNILYSVLANMQNLETGWPDKHISQVG